MERLQSVKEEIDRVNLEIQGAERDYDLNRAAELKYGTLLDLQKQLKEAEVALEQQVIQILSLLLHLDLQVINILILPLGFSLRISTVTWLWSSDLDCLHDSCCA